MKIIGNDNMKILMRGNKGFFSAGHRWGDIRPRRIGLHNEPFLWTFSEQAECECTRIKALPTFPLGSKHLRAAITCGFSQRKINRKGW